MKVAATGLLGVLFLALALLAADKPKKSRPADKEQKLSDDKRAAGGKMRTWTDKTGKSKVKAKFVALKDGKVTLETDEGKTVELAIDKLSASDQKIAKDLAKQAAENPFQEKAENPVKAGESSGSDKAEMSAADWSKVKKLEPEQIDKWSDKPDPAPAFGKSLTSQPISLTTAAGSNSEGGQNSFFASVDGLLFDRSHGQALAVIHDAAPGQPVVNKIQRVDLISGKTSQPITYPSVMKPVEAD